MKGKKMHPPSSVSSACIRKYISQMLLQYIWAQMYHRSEMQTTANPSHQSAVKVNNEKKPKVRIF